MFEWMKRAAALGAATIFGLGLAEPVWAQSATEAPLPPVFSTIDANGVDLATGEIGLSANQVAIGPAGDGGLNQSVTVGQALRDSLFGSLSVSQANSNSYTVTIGRSSVKFLKTATVNFTPDIGAAGQTLSVNSVAPDLPFYTYTYTTSDGTVVLFKTQNVTLVPSAAGQGNVALPTTMTRPSGEVLTYAYGTYDTSCPTVCKRLQAVTSSLGYMIKYDYQGTTAPSGEYLAKVTAINLASEYCSAAAACSFTRVWPSMTYTGIPLGTMTATDALGQVTTFNFGVGLNRTTTIQKPSGATVTYTYGGTIPLIRVTSYSDGVGTWTYGYGADTAGNHTSTVVTDPLGHTRTLTFDPTLGAVTSETNELGATTTYTLNAMGLITRVTMPEGNYTNYTYNSRGDVTEVRRVAKPGSGGLADYVVTATYPATCTNSKTCNKPDTVVVGGAQTDYTYDSIHGGVLTATGPAGANGVRPQTRYTYTALTPAYLTGPTTVTNAASVYKLTGSSQCMTLATCAGTADETKTTIAYAAANNAAVAGANNLQPSSMTRADGTGGQTSTRTFTYNAFGDIRTTTGPLSAAQTSRNRFDNNRQLVGQIEVDPDAASSGRPSLATRTTYNGDGQPILIEQGTVAGQSDAEWVAFSPTQQQTIAYNASGRMAQTTDASGGVIQSLTQFAYDAAGRESCRVLRMNPAVYGSLPASACTLGVAGAQGPDRITKTAYDFAGQPISVQDGVGTPQERYTSRQSYTANRMVMSMIDGNGNLTTFQFDGFDRPTVTAYPSPTTPGMASLTDYTSLAYDPTTWNLTQERRRDGQIVTYTYDARRRVTAKDTPATIYAYDNLDRRTSVTQAGRTLTTTYDAFGKVASVAGPLGTITYQYDADSRRTRMTWPDGFYVTYSYDNSGAMTAIGENGATSGLGLLATFAYDNVGRRQTLTRGNGVVTTYGYDSFSRLTSLTHNLPGTAYDEILGFTYNQADQIVGRTSTNATFAWADAFNLNRTYTINGRNQITTTSAPTTYSYDGRGNLTAEGAITYSYDIDNRLTGLSSGATLSYDPISRLFQTVSSGGTTTRFAYDVDDLVSEYDGANVLQRRYVHGPGNDEPLVWYEGTGTTDKRWMIADNQGSIIAITNTLGAVTTINRYDEYGIRGTGNDGRFQYTGQAWIPEAGVYHYKARAYSPSLGRFLQTDPIGYDDGLNLYAYVHDDPVDNTDPSGTLCILGMGDCDVEVAPVTVTAPKPRAPPPNLIIVMGVTVGAIPTELVIGGAAIPNPVYGVLAAASVLLVSDSPQRPTVHNAKPPKDAEDKKGAKAPGKPGPDTGYVEPRGGPEWVKNPNGKGSGWRDAKGNVWVPTGQGGSAHGGPHWDVQRPGGGHINVYPGGKTR